MELDNGEPKGPVPVLTMREKGLKESLGLYESLIEGPESKNVARFNDST